VNFVINRRGSSFEKGCGERKGFRLSEAVRNPFHRRLSRMLEPQDMMKGRAL